MKTNKITVSLEGIEIPCGTNQLNEDDSGNESKSKRSISAYENNVMKKGKNSKANNNLNQISMLNKKKKQRRSRLIMSEESDSIPEHKKEIYEGEAKIEKSLESASLFNNYINTQRAQLAKHFLKRKIKQNFEREDKHPVFFNVKFLPKQEMFVQSPVVTNSAQIQQQRANKQVPYQQGRPMMNQGVKNPIPQQNPPRPTYQNSTQQIPPMGVNPSNSKLFNVNSNSGNIQNKQPGEHNEPNKNGTTQISISLQNINQNINNAHHQHKQSTSLEQKEAVIKKITDKYNSDKEQLKRSIGSPEFRRIEAYLWKKGKIPNPFLNKSNSNPVGATTSVNPPIARNTSDLTSSNQSNTNPSK